VEPATGTVVFVEVRYRASLSHGGPLASIGHAKRLRLLRASRAWLAARRVDGRRPIRIDVVGVTSPSAVRDEPGWHRVEGRALIWVRHAVEL